MRRNLQWVLLNLAEIRLSCLIFVSSNQETSVIIDGEEANKLVLRFELGEKTATLSKAVLVRSQLSRFCHRNRPFFQVPVTRVNWNPDIWWLSDRANLPLSMRKGTKLRDLYFVCGRIWSNPTKIVFFDIFTVKLIFENSCFSGQEGWWG